MNVFGYSNYQDFLSDWLGTAKKEKRSSAAQLAKVINVHPTFLSQVMLKKKDLSSEHWISLCDFFELTEIEREYLHFLFLKNRAGTEQAKKFYQKKIEELLKKRLNLKERIKDNKELTQAERAIFYSSWIYSAVRMFCGVGDGQTLESISDKFGLKKNQLEEIINFLLKTGLCVERGTKILIGESHVHVSAGDPFVNKHHINWRVQSIQSLDHYTEEEMHFTAPMAISRKDFEVIREKVVKLIQETIEVAKESHAEDLAALTIDFFWPVKR